MPPRASSSRRLGATTWIAVVLVVGGLAARLVFGPASPGTGSAEEVVHRAVRAVASDDRDAYRAVSVTLADFDLRGADLATRTQGYVGSVLRPQLIDEQNEQFRRLRDGGFGPPFRDARFVRLGRLVESGSSTSVQGVPVPYATYGVVVRLDDREVDTSDDGPWFTVVGWTPRSRRLIAVIDGTR